MLVSSFRLIWIPMLWVYDNYKYSFSVWIVFRRQILTSSDVRFWRLNTIPALIELTPSVIMRLHILFCVVYIATLPSKAKRQTLLTTVQVNSHCICFEEKYWDDDRDFSDVCSCFPSIIVINLLTRYVVHIHITTMTKNIQFSDNVFDVKSL